MKVRVAECLPYLRSKMIILQFYWSSFKIGYIKCITAIIAAVRFLAKNRSCLRFGNYQIGSKNSFARKFVNHTCSRNKFEVDAFNWFICSFSCWFNVHTMAQAEFSRKLFGLMAAQDQNIVISPLSIYAAFGLVSAGAKGMQLFSPFNKHQRGIWS